MVGEVVKVTQAAIDIEDGMGPPQPYGTVFVIAVYPLGHGIVNDGTGLSDHLVVFDASNMAIIQGKHGDGPQACLLMIDAKGIGLNQHIVELNVRFVLTVRQRVEVNLAGGQLFSSPDLCIRFRRAKTAG